MKHAMTRALTIVILLTLAFSAIGWAETASEEQALEQEATRLTRTAGQPGGEPAVMGNLEKRFNMTAEQIRALRNRNLGYGEIAVVCSLAQKMPGGITDENMNRIMTMRQGPPTMGWGRIAQQLGTRLGPAVSAVRSMNREAAQEMRQTHERRQDRRMDGTGSGQMDRDQNRERQHRDMPGGGKMR